MFVADDSIFAPSFEAEQEDGEALQAADLLAVRLLGQNSAVSWLLPEQTGCVLAGRHLMLSHYDEANHLWVADAADNASLMSCESERSTPRLPAGRLRASLEGGRKDGGGLAQAVTATHRWAASHQQLLARLRRRVSDLVNKG